MKHEQRVVYGGVDTHQDVHVAAVIDEVGTLLGTKSFPTSELGLKSLQRWFTRHGRVARADALNTSIMAVSCLERGTNHDADLATRDRNWAPATRKRRIGLYNQ